MDQVGIKQVAAAAKVSRGTVDRVLHGRSGVNSRTRQRVLEIVRSLGYRPNFAARTLRRNLCLKIAAINFPAHSPLFFDSLRNGISAAVNPLSGTIKVQFYGREFCDSPKTAFDQTPSCGLSGVILAPGAGRVNRQVFDEAVRRGIPIVCVASDMPENPRLSAVMARPYVCGALAAEVIGLARSRPGAVAAVTGWLTNFNHSEKVRGFRTKLSDAPGLRVETVLETLDEPALVYDQTAKLLANCSDLRAIYVTTSHSLPVIEALRMAGRLAETYVVTTDLFNELKPLIRDRVVLATIHQKPFEQGQLAFRVLYEYLSEGVQPATVINVNPALILSSNMEGAG